MVNCPFAPPHLKLEFQPQNVWGEGVRGYGTREALFAAEIGKFTNSQGGGGWTKKGVRLEQYGQRSLIIF